MYHIYTVTRTPSFKCYFTAGLYKNSVVVLQISLTDMQNQLYKLVCNKQGRVQQKRRATASVGVRQGKCMSEKIVGTRNSYDLMHPWEGHNPKEDGMLTVVPYSLVVGKFLQTSRS